MIDNDYFFNFPKICKTILNIFQSFNFHGLNFGSIVVDSPDTPDFDHPTLNSSSSALLWATEMFLYILEWYLGQL